MGRSNSFYILEVYGVKKQHLMRAISSAKIIIMGKVSKGSYPSHHAHIVGRRLENEAAAIYYYATSATLKVSNK